MECKHVVCTAWVAHAKALMSMLKLDLKQIQKEDDFVYDKTAHPQFLKYVEEFVELTKQLPLS